MKHQQIYHITLNYKLSLTCIIILTFGGNKVIMYSVYIQHNPWRRLKWSSAVTRLTTHFTDDYRFLRVILIKYCYAWHWMSFRSPGAIITLANASNFVQMIYVLQSFEMLSFLFDKMHIQCVAPCSTCLWSGSSNSHNAECLTVWWMTNRFSMLRYAPKLRNSVHDHYILWKWNIKLNAVNPNSFSNRFSGLLHVPKSFWSVYYYNSTIT